MTDNYIQIENKEVLKLGIRTSDGVDTGKFLEFDLDDTGLLLRYQEMIEKDKKNKENLKNQLYLIEKRPDIKGKKLLTKNEEDKLRALDEFFKKEEEVYDMFLGEGGVKKLLYGRKLGWTSLKEIDEIIEKQISPKLNITMDSITNKIKEKYGTKKDSKEVL